jgi:hypothetical protein
MSTTERTNFFGFEIKLENERELGVDSDVGFQAFPVETKEAAN